MACHLFSSLSITLILFSAVSFSPIDSKSPLIFVPGSFCSLLQVRINTTLQPSCPSSLHNQWILLWLNLRLIEPNLLPCYHQIFGMIYNSSSNSFENPPGVETRLVPNSINGSFLDGILWEYIGLDKFLLYFTRKHNYTDGLNIHSIPYDFRRGTSNPLLIFVNQLKELIEWTYHRNGNERVYLVSHSTGGSMVLFFLSQQSQPWKDQYIQSWISLSGNIAGEVDNIESVIAGFLTPVVPRDVLQSWDFFAWRLPEPIAYGSQRILISTPSKNYTSSDMQALLHTLNATGLAQIYPEASSILGTLPSPNVNTYCFYGINVSTPIAYISKSDDFDSRKIETIHGDGDGEQDDTTNMSCQLWKQTMDRKYQLTLKGFDRISHLELVGNNQVLEKIGEIISSKIVD